MARIWYIFGRGLAPTERSAAMIQMFRERRDVMWGRFMHRVCLAVALAAGMIIPVFVGSAQNAPSGGP